MGGELPDRQSMGSVGAGEGGGGATWPDSNAKGQSRGAGWSGEGASIGIRTVCAGPPPEHIATVNVPLSWSKTGMNPFGRGARASMTSSIRRLAMRLKPARLRPVRLMRAARCRW